MKTGPAANELALNHSLQRKSIIREKLEIEAMAPAVSVQGYHYLVDFGQLTNPRFHKVSKNKDCSCGAPYCEAIEAVRLYLQAGGPRAPDPEGMPPCPICESRTYRDRKWDGKYTKTLGWRCEKGGLKHFLEAKARRIKQQFADNPWLFPPSPGYPGVRRDELLTWKECQAPLETDDPMI